MVAAAVEQGGGEGMEDHAADVLHGGTLRVLVLGTEEWETVDETNLYPHTCTAKALQCATGHFSL